MKQKTKTIAITPMQVVNIPSFLECIQPEIAITNNNERIPMKKLSVPPTLGNRVSDIRKLNG